MHHSVFLCEFSIWLGYRSSCDYLNDCANDPAEVERRLDERLAESAL